MGTVALVYKDEEFPHRLAGLGLQLFDERIEVFHTPPAAVPTNMCRGRLSTTATAVIRPPMLAGPIARAVKTSRRLSVTAGGSAAAGVPQASQTRAKARADPARTCRAFRFIVVGHVEAR